MPQTRKAKFGHMACPDCSSRVVVKVNDKETLSYSCDECDGNGYSKKGEARYELWLKKITRTAAPAGDPAAAAAATAASGGTPGGGGEKKPGEKKDDPPPAAKARATVFG